MKHNSDETNQDLEARMQLTRAQSDTLRAAMGVSAILGAMYAEDAHAEEHRRAPAHDTPRIETVGEWTDGRAQDHLAPRLSKTARERMDGAVFSQTEEQAIAAFIYNIERPGEVRFVAMVGDYLYFSMRGEHGFSTRDQFDIPQDTLPGQRRALKRGYPGDRTEAHAFFTVEAATDVGMVCLAEPCTDGIGDRFSPMDIFRFYQDQQRQGDGVASAAYVLDRSPDGDLVLRNVEDDESFHMGRYEDFLVACESTSGPYCREGGRVVAERGEGRQRLRIADGSRVLAVLEHYMLLPPVGRRSRPYAHDDPGSDVRGRSAFRVHRDLITQYVQDGSEETRIVIRHDEEEETRPPTKVPPRQDRPHEDGERPLDVIIRTTDCNDGFDNDEDGRVDGADPDCLAQDADGLWYHNLLDDDESGPGTKRPRTDRPGEDRRRSDRPHTRRHRKSAPLSAWDAFQIGAGYLQQGGSGAIQNIVGNTHYDPDRREHGGMISLTGSSTVGRSHRFRIQYGAQLAVFHDVDHEQLSQDFAPSADDERHSTGTRDNYVSTRTFYFNPVLGFMVDVSRVFSLGFAGAPGLQMIEARRHTPYMATFDENGLTTDSTDLAEPFVNQRALEFGGHGIFSMCFGQPDGGFEACVHAYAGGNLAQDWYSGFLITVGGRRARESRSADPARPISAAEVAGTDYRGD